MADTTSIASRMEKLAKLKRMKQGLSATAAPSQADVSAPETALEEPATTFAAHPAPETDTFDDIERAYGFDEAGSAADPLEAAGHEFTEIEEEFPGDTGIIDEAPADGETGATTAAFAGEPGIEDDAALDDLLSEAGTAEPEIAETATEEQELPDFAQKEIDADLLEREFSGDAPVRYREDDEEPADLAVAAEEEDGRVTITFDQGRSTLLNHVARQMDCSVEDVVITALDWYLDALFGEQEEAKAG